MISHENRLGTYLQVFTDIPGELVSFKLIKQGSEIAMDLNPSLSTLPERTMVITILILTIHSVKMNRYPRLATALVNAYPNPFRGSTSISLNVEKDNSP